MALPFTLQQLRIVKAIATEKNFKAAAELLFVSQPSLSKQIQALEYSLGVSLFDRTNRKVTLTEAGKIFLQYTDRTLSLCEETCRAMEDLKNGERGNLTVGGSQTIGTYLMQRVLAVFGQKYNQITLNVKVDSTKYQGYAFGIGIDRLAMLKYGINDLRAFFECDYRWLNHFGFDPLDVPTSYRGLSR